MRALARYVAQPDKALHVAACFVIALALQLADVPTLETLWLCLGVAWAKESWDKGHPELHTWDGWDAFATLAGGLLGVTVWANLAPSWRVG